MSVAALLTRHESVQGVMVQRIGHFSKEWTLLYRKEFQILDKRSPRKQEFQVIHTISDTNLQGPQVQIA